MCTVFGDEVLLRFIVTIYNNVWKFYRSELVCFVHCIFLFNVLVCSRDVFCLMLNCSQFRDHLSLVQFLSNIFCAMFRVQ